MLNVKFALLVALAFIFGALSTSNQKTVRVVEIEGQAWCYWADFKSLDDFGYVQAPAHSLIDIHSKGVRVFEKCGDN